MSQNTYSLLETGKTKLDVERLILIAEFYKISAYDLLDISPPKEVKHSLKN
jgi:transcriptional regulator with XRE-family HTH domain